MEGNHEKAITIFGELITNTIHFIMVTPIFAKDFSFGLNDTNFATTTTNENYKNDKNCKDCSGVNEIRKPLALNANVLSDIEQLKQKVKVEGNQYKFDRNKYIKLKDKNGKTFVMDKKYLDLVKDPSKIDTSKNQVPGVDAYKTIIENEASTPVKNLTQSQILKDIQSTNKVIKAACSGTGPRKSLNGESRVGTPTSRVHLVI